MIQIMGRFNGDRNDRDTRSDRGGRDSRGGGRSSFGRGGGFGRGSDGPREMFKTVCSNCGKDCEVPFRPTTGKPVYCSDCFEKMGGRNSDGGRPERSDRSSFDRNDRPQAPRVDNSKSFDDLNKKLDKIISLLTPKEEKTVIEEVVVAPVVEEAPKVKPVKTPKDKQSLPLRGKKAKIVKEEATA